MTDPRLADSAPDAEHPRQRYDFREHIGSGGMADVYRARDTELGRDVAVKVFRADDDTVADLQRREREIRLLSRLNHPGLVGIHDAGVLMHEGVPRRYVVMEYVDGRSLAHRLARRSDDASPRRRRRRADGGRAELRARACHRASRREAREHPRLGGAGARVHADGEARGLRRGPVHRRLPAARATARSWAPRRTSRPSRPAAR